MEDFFSAKRSSLIVLVVLELVDHKRAERKARTLIHVRKACPLLAHTSSLKARDRHDYLYSFSSPPGIGPASEESEIVVRVIENVV